MSEISIGSSWVGTSGPRFVERVSHRHWLLNQATSLLDFFQYSAFNPQGGFFTLSNTGFPNRATAGHSGVERQLHDTSRMVHCFSIGHMLGHPGAERTIDHGMNFIWNRHRDTVNGGYFWGVDDIGPTNATKQAYGHAFVILAASSAKVVGHPDADRLMDDVMTVLMSRFWDKTHGATTEEYAADWTSLGDYRGQNSNMHLTEALMAAYEATGNNEMLSMAETIAALIINRHARNEDWRVAEHFDSEWNIDRDYAGDPMFRPKGTTPGHALEWSRLLVQLYELGGRKQDWMLEAAKGLFLKTTDLGWDKASGGFFYTLDWNNRPDQKDHFWWPCAEGLAAAAVLASITGEQIYETWYRRILGFINNYFIDRENGGWTPELDSHLKPVNTVFTGKPDLYHGFQACLIPLLPTHGSITKGLAGTGMLSILTA